MTRPAGRAAIEILGDVSKFLGQLQRDIDKALSNVKLEGLDDASKRAFKEIARDAERAFESIGREVEQATDNIGTEFQTSGEKAEDALKEVGSRGRTEFNQLERHADQAGTNIGATFRRLAGVLAGVFVVATVARYFSSAAQAAEDLGSAIANTEQIIKSTGGTAGLLAADIRKISQELSLKIGVDSVEVQNAANVMLTFKNVTGTTFKTAIGLAADLSAVLGTDLQGATLQLGKALNDPVLGVTALARAGIQFTPIQKEQIKNFVETNQLAKAQGIILQEVTSQVGGVAEAGADSTDKLAVAFLELKRIAGDALIGLVDEAAPALLQLATDVAPAFQAVGVSVAELVKAVMPILVPLVDLIADSLTELAPSLVPLGAALAKIVVAAAPLLPLIVDLAVALASGLTGALNVAAGPLALVANFLASSPALAYTLIGAYVAWTLVTNQATVAQVLLRASMIAGTVVQVASTLAMAAFGNAIAAATVKQYLLNIALNSNPIGAVIILVTAVTAAFAIAWQASDKFREVITSLFGVVDQTNFKMIGMETTLGRTNAQLTIAAGKAAETAAAERVLAGTIQDVAAAGRSLIDVWDQLHGKMLTADETALAAKTTIAALGQTFKDGKFAMDRHSEAGLTNRVALQHAAQAAAAAAQAYLDQTGDVQGAARMMDRYRADAIRATGATGSAKAAVAALAKEVFQLPKNATTQISVRVLGLDRLRTMNSMLQAAMMSSGQYTVAPSGGGGGRPPGMHMGGVTTREGLANLHAQEMVLPLGDARATSLLARALAEADAGLRAVGVAGPAGSTHIQVFLGTREITDIVDVRVAESNRMLKRAVTAGSR